MLSRQSSDSVIGELQLNRTLGHDQMHLHHRNVFSQSFVFFDGNRWQLFCARLFAYKVTEHNSQTFSNNFSKNRIDLTELMKTTSTIAPQPLTGFRYAVRAIIVLHSGLLDSFDSMEKTGAHSDGQISDAVSDTSLFGKITVQVEIHIFIFFVFTLHELQIMRYAFGNRRLTYSTCIQNLVRTPPSSLVLYYQAGQWNERSPLRRQGTFLAILALKLKSET